MINVFILRIPFNFGGKDDFICPVVLKDEKNMILVDCGYTGSLPMLEKAIQEKEITCSQLTHILITHHDHDHMGSLYELKQKYPNIIIVSGKIEEPYISGKMKSFRLEQIESLLKILPREQKPIMEKYYSIINSVRPVNVNSTVNEGDKFDWCGGCTIMATPGHTSGHISLFLDKENTLIAGDACTISNDDLIMVNPQQAFDVELAQVSLDKIKNSGVKRIICYHGGVFEYK